MACFAQGFSLTLQYTHYFLAMIKSQRWNAQLIKGLDQVHMEDSFGFQLYRENLATIMVIE